MITKEMESLQMCLQKLGLRELPSALEAGCDDSFLTAIVLTKRKDGSKAYCIAENDGNNKPVIKMDFGPCVSIHSIEKVYPTQRIDRKVVPTLKNDEEIIEYLCKSKYDNAEIEKLLSKSGKTAQMIEKDRQTVYSYILKTAMEFTKLKAKEEERVVEIKNYSKRIKNGKERKKEKTDD